jgi:hypothetical protein
LPEPPKKTENLIDFFGSTPQEEPKPQSFAFDFINSSAQPAEQKPAFHDLLGFGSQPQ